MYSYNNIIDKGEPQHTELIDRALDDQTAIPKSTQHRVSPEVDCIVVDNFLTPDECDALIAACEKTGFSFWQQTTHDVNGGESSCNTESNLVRVVDTIEANFEHLSQHLFKRIAAVVNLESKYFSRDTQGDEESCERDLEGEWVPYALSSNLLFGRYKPGGHFMPHIDGSTIVDLNTRSFYALLLYLNACPEGGETHLFSGEQHSVVFMDTQSNKLRGSASNRVGSVEAKKGRAAFFYYDLLHEGAPVVSGLKYICRADLLYRRNPPIFTSEKDKEAFALYQSARVLESSGEAARACELFQRVRKVSKGVAELYHLD
ncbi:unnamed protein product [Phytomonas sp. Hart1]|nr:unnamed protein product [Phytomonas sp. Hart1]|eukprot:CCW72170.1 unnamed protein product [Phytomonas sp. isolate Hart1]